MFERIKRNWQHLKESPTGERFRRRYERRQEADRGTVYRVFCIGGGLLLMIAGLVMLAAPGPGIIVLFIGGGLVAQESELAARGLDGAEVRLRKGAAWGLKRWRRAAPAVKALVVLVALAGAGALGFVAYRLLFA